MAYHPDDTDSEESSGDVAVELDTLATEDGTMPEAGDEVDLSVMGRVSRIDEAANCAYVTPELVNGEPPPHKEKESPGTSLKRQAQEADDDAGY